MPLLSDVGYYQSRHDALVAKIKNQEKIISDAIKKLAKMYVAEYSLESDAEINEGLCDEFAHDLKFIFPSVEVVWVDEIHPGMKRVAHAVAIFEGKYYDSECPEGTETVSDIPFVVRHMNGVKEKQ